MIVTIGILILVLVDLIFDHHRYIMNFHFFGILFLGTRLIIEFRIIGRVRHLVAMIIRVYFDILTFLAFFIGYMFLYAFLEGTN